LSKPDQVLGLDLDSVLASDSIWALVDMEPEVSWAVSTKPPWNYHILHSCTGHFKKDHGKM